MNAFLRARSILRRCCQFCLDQTRFGRISRCRAAERAVPEVLESQHSVVKLKDLQTGEETFVAFRPGKYP
jgi:hypothetical protein